MVQIFSDIGSLANNLPVLEEINLMFCENLMEAGLIAFLGKSSGRLQLKLDECSDVDVNTIQAAFPNINIF